MSKIVVIAVTVSGPTSFQSTWEPLIKCLKVLILVQIRVCRKRSRNLAGDLIEITELNACLETVAQRDDPISNTIVWGLVFVVFWTYSTDRLMLLCTDDGVRCEPVEPRQMPNAAL
ncbi:hypothetical protein WAI453_009233 [Rhynchosporium graminicola]